MDIPTLQVALCKNNTNTFDCVPGKLWVKICTDRMTESDPNSGKPITNERVILVLSGLVPAGEKEFYTALTDKDGIAKFEITERDGQELPGLPVPARRPVCIVLPDILEHWSSDPSTQVHYHFATVGSSSDSSKEQSASKDGSPVKEYGPISLEYSKDGIDNAAEPKPKPPLTSYRSLDFTRHVVLTQSLKEKKTDPVVINIDKLTQEEKFQHFLFSHTANNATFQSPYRKVGFPQTTDLGYFKNNPRWVWANGNKCNGNINFFLGYWFNYNEQFTWQGSSTEIYKLFGFDSSQHIHWKRENPTAPWERNEHRGYSDFIDQEPATDNYYPFHAPSAVTLPVGPVTAQYALARIGYFLVSNYFTNVTGLGGGLTTSAGNSLISRLEDFNFYSIWDSNHGVDHHGGVLLRRAIGGGAPVNPTATTELYTFQADDSIDTCHPGNHLIMKTFLDHDVYWRRNWSFKAAIFKLKKLRNGGYGPLAAQGNAGGISVYEPARFLMWR